MKYTTNPFLILFLLQLDGLDDGAGRQLDRLRLHIARHSCEQVAHRRRSHFRFKRRWKQRRRRFGQMARLSVFYGRLADLFFNRMNRDLNIVRIGLCNALCYMLILSRFRNTES